MDLKKPVYGLVLVTPCLLFAGLTSGAELKFNTQDFAPFNYEVGGGVSGAAPDIIRRICSEVKIDCSMHLLPWRRAQDEVANGTAHGLFVIGWNNEERPSGKPRFPTPPWNQH